MSGKSSVSKQNALINVSLGKMHKHYAASISRLALYNNLWTNMFLSQGVEVRYTSIGVLEIVYPSKIFCNFDCIFHQRVYTIVISGYISTCTVSWRFANSSTRPTQYLLSCKEWNLISDQNFVFFLMFSYDLLRTEC